MQKKKVLLGAFLPCKLTKKWKCRQTPQNDNFIVPMFEYTYLCDIDRHGRCIVLILQFSVFFSPSMFSMVKLHALFGQHHAAFSNFLLAPCPFYGKPCFKFHVFAFFPEI